MPGPVLFLETLSSSAEGSLVHRATGWRTGICVPSRGPPQPREPTTRRLQG